MSQMSRQLTTGSRVAFHSSIPPVTPATEKETVVESQEKPKVKFEQADHLSNARPTAFDKDTIMQNIDPKTMIKKEPSYEWRTLPKDGIEKNEYHPMQALDKFPNTDNDISKEYGFKIKGLEPTRYGDWERKGIAVDF